MEQTAVEWLVNELKESIGLKDLHAIEKAKEMEKQQIIDAFNKGFVTDQWDKSKENKAKQYYNETFKMKHLNQNNMENSAVEIAIKKIDEQIEIAQKCRIEASKVRDETSTSRHHGMKIALVAFRQELINLLEVEQQQMKKKRITNRERMTNRDILEWADSKGIVEMVNLMEKYEFKNGASLDVDDYRIIYEAESKALLQRNL